MQCSRRNFIQTTLAAGAIMHTTKTLGAPTHPTPYLGVCTSSVQEVEALKQIGFDFVESGVNWSLKPQLDDEQFAPELKKLRSFALPIRSCNGLLPKELRLTGPQERLRHQAAIDHILIAAQRATSLGVKVLVLGSGRARNAPENYDIEQARQQFIEFCRLAGAAIAHLDVIIALEPLNKREANYLNSVAEGIEMIDTIAHPRIQLLADIYHMMVEKEPPEAIRKAGARLVHCHVAELEGRKYPGHKNEDLRPYYRALRDIDYRLGLSCECGWPKQEREKAWQTAYDTLTHQWQSL